MDEKRRNRRDFIQNIAITLLSLSAVALITQTQLYNLGAEAGTRYLGQLLAEPAGTQQASVSQQTVLAAPVRVAITGAYGRYGDVTLVTSDEDFRPLGSLLKDALGSAKAYTACTQEAFLAALGRTSVYYDFLSPLPLSVLAGFTSASCDSNVAARCLILSDMGEEGVQLYLWDGGSTYQSCSTAVARSDLESTANRYELGNAVFAFDLADTAPAYAHVMPCSLFLSEELPELPVLHVSNPLAETDWLLSALQFNPRTNSRYTESSGAEVVGEGERSLRIHPDGSVFYRSGGEAVLTVDAAVSDAPTAWEAAAGASALVSSLFTSSGNAAPYLQSVYQNSSSTVVRFGYQVKGVPIRFSDGSYAAEVTLTGSTISTLSLHFRQYTATGEKSLLLPLRQALAIAAKSDGAELSLGYADNGAAALSACWLAG